MKIFKKISLLLFYKKTIKKHEEELRKNHNIKIDFIGRCYTSIKIPEDIMKTNHKYTEMNKKVIYDYITGEMSTITQKFREYGLFELVHLSDVSPSEINKKYYNAIIEFKYFSLKKYFKYKLYTCITLLISVLYFLSIFI